jgi:hypothetical protein
MPISQSSLKVILCLLAVIADAVEQEQPSNLSEVTVDLQNPRYSNGVLFTSDGGVIRGDNLRIQAQSIQYINRMENGKPVHRIEAEGDLMMQYHGKVFVGSELDYDFIRKTGVVYDAKTSASLWYVGGDRIYLNADGSYKTENAFFTTCENADSFWDIHVGRLDVLKNGLLKANKIRFRLFRIPIFWLPSFKINLKKFREPIFRYSVNMDKGGPRVSARYQLYSWRDFAFYGRLDYRFSTGFGGAFETEFAPQDRNLHFDTRSYIGTDKLENALDKEFRYRLQGAWRSESASGKTHTTLTWDKYSDVRMPNDFKSEDFEVNTAKNTLFSIHHQEAGAITSLKVRPRVNPFESIQQDLPSLYCCIKPGTIGKSGVMYDMWAKASYLDFVYSDQLMKTNTPLLSQCSSRLEAHPLLYRPFQAGIFHLTPHIGLDAIFYGSSRSGQPKNLVFLIYGGTVQARGRKDFASIRHEIQPYVRYQGFSKPTSSVDAHYIFGIQDGCYQINKLQIGLRNIASPVGCAIPCCIADLYTNAFFAENKFPQPIPKLYLLLNWNFPSLDLSIHNAWNFRHQTLDFFNTRLQLTVNENVAFAFDLRYRSQYDWRKTDHENFLLDVARWERELLESPLSDRRMSIITHAFFRLTPFWELQIESHHGFLREKQKNNPPRKHPYNECKVDLFTWLSANCKLRLTYSHTINDDRVSAGISLVKNR